MKSATNIRFEFQGGFKDGDVEVEGLAGWQQMRLDKPRGQRFTARP